MPAGSRGKSSSVIWTSPDPHVRGPSGSGVGSEAIRGFARDYGPLGGAAAAESGWRVSDAGANRAAAESADENADGSGDA